MIEYGEKEKLIKYPDEKPRDILNAESCIHQYACLVKYIWEPSTIELKKKLDTLWVT